MRFNRGWVRPACAAALILGCAKQNESPTNIPDVGLANGRTACLAQTSQTLRAYVDGRLGDGEITEYFGCLTRVVAMFERYAKGRDPLSFTPDEIRNFLQETKVIEAKIPDDLLQELMQFKRVLISGTALHLGRNEFERIYSLLGMVRDVAVRARAAVPKLFHPSSQEEFRASFESVDLTLEPFVQQLMSNRQPYHLQNFTALVEAWAKWGEVHESSFVGFVQKSAPILQTAKTLLLGSANDSILDSDWSTLRKVAMKGMEAYLLFQNFYSSNGWYEARNFSVVDDIAHLAFDIIESGLRRQPEQMWTDTDIRKVLDIIQDLDIIPFKVTPDAMQEVVSILTHKILKSQPEVAGFGLPQLEKLREFWRAFYLRQVELQQDPNWDVAALPLDNEGRWIIDADHGAKWDLRSASQYHIERTLIERLLATYSLSAVPELQPTELMALAQDFSHLLFDLLDQTPEKFTKRLVQEANVFLPSSDGKVPITAMEATEYLHSLLSGLNAGKLAKSQIVNLAALPPMSVLSHLPGFSSRMKATDWKNLAPLLEAAARGTETGSLTTGHYVSMWIMLQYIEVFMWRFDSNKDATIGKEESLTAYKIYGPTLTELVQSYNLNADEVRALYTYLFRYGEVPTDTFTGSLKFLMWKWNENTWSFAADRSRLGQILSRLSSLQ